MKHHVILAAVIGAAVAVGSIEAQTRPGRNAATAPASAPASSALAKYVRTEIAAALDHLQESDDWAAAGLRLQALYDLAISRAGDRQFDILRDADFALRLVRQLAKAPENRRADLLKFLRSHDGFARTLVFLVDEEDDSLPGVFGLVDRFRAQRANQIDAFTNLAAAICVVHDEPFERDVNEVTLKSPDPLAIFDYYVANERSMLFGIRNVPPELLMYVVDTTASIDEMQWALSKYAHDQNVGRHFFDIKYDDEYFEQGKTKKLSQVPYNLPDILKVGGVCADQAYFAVAIGKAIGVPTAYARGKSAETGHAWVGFLQQQGQKGIWNFDTGRYEEFKGVRAMVIDPQTGHEIPDAFVSFTAELIGTKDVDRQTAEALTDSVERMRHFEDQPDKFGAAAAATLPAEIAEIKVARKPVLTAELELIRQSLIQNPGHEDGWGEIAALAADGKLSLDQKKQWSDELLVKCGQRYPDFALAVVTPMIETVEDPNQQNSLWNGAFNRFQNRFDLAATIRIEQAGLWEKQKDIQKAGTCYLDVIDRYVNAGPFVLTALEDAEDDLRTAGLANRVPALYEQAWAKCQKPEDMAGQFTRQSNWYKIGMLLAQKQAEAGNNQRSQAVLGQIKSVMAGR